MPAVFEYLPPVSSERKDINLKAFDEKARRLDEYHKAVRYYEGNQPPQLEFDPEIEPDDNTVINIIKMAADRTASFLFPKIPKIKVDVLELPVFNNLDWPVSLIKANGGLNFLIRMALRGFLSGHVFIRVIPPTRKSVNRQYPRFVLLDPSAVNIFWSYDDPNEVVWYEMRFVKDKHLFLQDFVWRPDLGDFGSWEIYTYKSTKPVNILNPTFSLINENINFELVPAQNGKPAAVHMSPIPPIVEFPHLPHPNDRYGASEAGQLHLQDTINRLWSEINRIVRKHADPRDVVIGADLDTIEPGQDITAVPNADAKVQRLELRGNLSAATETVKELTKLYLTNNRVVIISGEPRDLQRVTNTAVRTVFIDALAKNETLRESYGYGLTNLIKLSMMMSNLPFATRALEADVTIVWPDPLPIDQNELANVNILLHRIGARSRRSIAASMGNIWDEEVKYMNEEFEVDLEKALRKARAFSDLGLDRAIGTNDLQSPGFGNLENPIDKL